MQLPHSKNASERVIMQFQKASPKKRNHLLRDHTHKYRELSPYAQSAVISRFIPTQLWLAVWM
ncbi:hypothetical protein NSE_0886 [Neorickettsia sennetsu str. Miyayama]|uniref:Uncharacterized protein n=1 Tax=Ehrlichia sennetsu (strain ATCC VR-367 / Miyayama) TaxID=222891 RepID=Q2GCP4_EHRS3|nr:hypothetical protein NSE_0886 [Neorickettsia sennetsu str. Miyayama]